VCVGDHLSEEGQEIETEEKNTMYTMWNLRGENFKNQRWGFKKCSYCFGAN
jgi:hypothetical protein